MSRILDWLSELEAATASTPDEVDPAELEALCAALQAEPEAISPAAAPEVVARLERLADWARGQSEGLSEELRALGGGRRAMRGYATLRSAHTAQRLFKRA